MYQSNYSAEDLAQMAGASIEEVRNAARSAGINLSHKSVSQKIADQRSGAEGRVRSGVTRPNWYNTVREQIVALGDGTVLVGTLLIQYFAPVLGMVAIYASEVARIIPGVKMFDTHNATLLGHVIVMIYISLLVVQSQQKYQRGLERKQVYSFRQTYEHWLYMLGLGSMGGDEWQPRYKEAVSMPTTAIKLMGLVIIVTSTFGSLHEMLPADVPTAEGIRFIINEFAIQQHISLLGAFLYTLSLVVSMHWVIDYMYGRFAVISPESVQTFTYSDSDLKEAGDVAERELLLGLLYQQARKNQPQPMSEEATQEVVPVTPALEFHIPAPNGNQ